MALRVAIECAERYGRPRVNVNGHCYDVNDIKLVEVRCVDHEPRDV